MKQIQTRSNAFGNCLKYVFECRLNTNTRKVTLQYITHKNVAVPNIMVAMCTVYAKRGLSLTHLRQLSCIKH